MKSLIELLYYLKGKDKMISAEELRLKMIEDVLIECAEYGKREAQFEYPFIKDMIEDLKSLGYTVILHYDLFDKITYVIVRW